MYYLRYLPLTIIIIVVVYYSNKDKIKEQEVENKAITFMRKSYNKETDDFTFAPSKTKTKTEKSLITTFTQMAKLDNEYLEKKELAIEELNKASDMIDLAKKKNLQNYRDKLLITRDLYKNYWTARNQIFKDVYNDGTPPDYRRKQIKYFTDTLDALNYTLSYHDIMFAKEGPPLTEEQIELVLEGFSLLETAVISENKYLEANDLHNENRLQLLNIQPEK